MQQLTNQMKNLLCNMKSYEGDEETENKLTSSTSQSPGTSHHHLANISNTVTSESVSLKKELTVGLMNSIQKYNGSGGMRRLKEYILGIENCLMNAEIPALKELLLAILKLSG